MPGHIVAVGVGGFSMEPENPLFDRFVLSLARRPRPSVCFLPTASGDAEDYVTRFYRAFCGHDCRPTDLSLFRPQVSELRTFLLEQDVLYVGGGSTVNLLAVWRIHGLDTLVAQALDAGAVLVGLSAGMHVCFECSVTRSLGSKLEPLHDGFGLVGGSACAHYDGDPGRRPLYRGLVDDGFPAGYALDDGAALHFAGGRLVEVVSSRPLARAYRVEPGLERPLETRYLGQSAHASDEAVSPPPPAAFWRR